MASPKHCMVLAALAVLSSSCWATRSGDALLVPKDRGTLSSIMLNMMSQCPAGDEGFAVNTDGHFYQFANQVSCGWKVAPELNLRHSSMVVIFLQLVSTTITRAASHIIQVRILQPGCAYA